MKMFLFGDLRVSLRVDGSDKILLMTSRHEMDHINMMCPTCRNCNLTRSFHALDDGCRRALWTKSF